MNLRQLGDGVAKFWQELEQFDKVGSKSNRHVGDLKDTIGGLGNETVATKKRIDSTTLALGKLGTAFALFSRNVDKHIIRWEDVSKEQIRGSRLLSTHLGTMRSNWSRLHKLSTQYAQITGQSAEESTMAMRGMMEGLKLHGADVHDFWETTGVDVKKYTQSVAAAQRFSNTSSQEMAEFQRRMMIGLRQDLHKTEEIIQGMTQATIQFGLVGGDTIQTINEHLDKLLTAESHDRAKMMEKQMIIAGIQQRSMVDFGKYVKQLAGDEGINQLVKAAKLAQFSGKDPDEVLAQMMGAKAGGMGVLRLAETIDAAIQNISPGMAELQAKAYAEKLGKNEATQLAIMQETALATVGATVGMSIADITSMMAAYKKVRKEGGTDEEIFKRFREERGRARKKQADTYIGEATDAFAFLRTDQERAAAVQGLLAESAHTLNTEFLNMSKLLQDIRTRWEKFLPLMEITGMVAGGLLGVFTAVRIGKRFWPGGRGPKVGAGSGLGSMGGRAAGAGAVGAGGTRGVMGRGAKMGAKVGGVGLAGAGLAWLYHKYMAGDEASGMTLNDLIQRGEIDPEYLKHVVESDTRLNYHGLAGVGVGIGGAYGLAAAAKTRVGTAVTGAAMKIPGAGAVSKLGKTTGKLLGPAYIGYEGWQAYSGAFTESGRTGTRQSLELDKARVVADGIGGHLKNFLGNWLSPGGSIAKVITQARDSMDAASSKDRMVARELMMYKKFISVDAYRTKFAREGKVVDAFGMKEANARGDTGAIRRLTEQAVSIQAVHETASRLHFALTNAGYYANYQFLYNKARAALQSGRSIDVATLTTSSRVRPLVDVGGLAEADIRWRRSLGDYATMWSREIGGKGLDINKIQRQRMGTPESGSGAVDANLIPNDNRIPAMDRPRPETNVQREARVERSDQAASLEAVLSNHLSSIVELLDLIHRNGSVTTPV